MNEKLKLFFSPVYANKAIKCEENEFPWEKLLLFFRSYKRRQRHISAADRRKEKLCKANSPTTNVITPVVHATLHSLRAGDTYRVA